MDTYWVWWGMALILVIMEMFSGTLYLLAVALGLAMAGGCAYLGMSWGVQVTVATLWCSGSLWAIHRWKKNSAPPSSQANFSYDLGQSVKVVSWMDARHARVSYRGAEWDAELSAEAVGDAQKVVWRIKAIAGSHLVIE